MEVVFGTLLIVRYKEAVCHSGMSVKRDSIVLLFRIFFSNERITAKALILLEFKNLLVSVLFFTLVPVRLTQQCVCLLWQISLFINYNHFIKCLQFIFLYKSLPLAM